MPKCYNCGKEMKHGTEYSWTTDLGSFMIPCLEDEYAFCDCGEERLAYSLCLRIERTEHDFEQLKEIREKKHETEKW